MARIGLFLSSEEHGPKDLVSYAELAEHAGMDAVMISDHFHPWLDVQGQSSFVWAVIGAIAERTQLHVTTGVTCPTVRTHPAVVAQATATAALLLDGRFCLGVGSGEALNEHITGQKWPAAAGRQEMLEEAVEIIRALWSGDNVNRHGPHFAVENARLYSRPQQPPPILVSGFGPAAIELAARIGDGFVTVAPDPDAVAKYRSSGGNGPAVGSVKVCWDTDEGRARKLAHRIWPTESLPGQLAQELPTPRHFEQAATLVTEEMVTSHISCGPDPALHVAAIQKYVDAGFDEIYINQLGDGQAGFLDFYRSEIRPALMG